MNCRICETAVIGKNYALSADSGHRCGRCEAMLAEGIVRGTYQGKNDGGDHVFRVHPAFYCSVCRASKPYAYMPCGDQPSGEGISLEELYALFGVRKEVNNE